MLIAAALLLAAPAPPGPGTHTFAVASGGLDWECHARVPPGYDPAKPPPLVLILHGAGGDGPSYLTKNHWAAKADAAGFVAVAPSGRPALRDQPADFRTNPRIWNSGQLGRQNPRAKLDDVAFVRALLDDLAVRLPHDPKRVFVTGHSNGAGMTFRLGAELSERFAALAPVAGMVAVPDPKPTHPRPTLYIIGDRDPLQPLAGGEVKLPWGPARTNKPVSDYLTRWAAALGCPPTAKPVSDAGGVKTVEYGPGQGGSFLRVKTIAGHGHPWPGGGASGLPASLIGPESGKLNATDAVWEFFQEVAGK